MGLAFSRFWARMFGKTEMRILMVGLDAAGVTIDSYSLFWILVIKVLLL
jgi:hypothetical protein